MASLLIFSRRSNTQLTELQRYGQPERGDVVDLRSQDTFYWGRAIDTVGWWRVVVVPGVPSTVLQGLVSTSSRESSKWPSAWRHRLWRIDLDALAAGQLSFGTWVVPLERLLAAASIKAEACEAPQLAVISG